MKHTTIKTVAAALLVFSVSIKGQHAYFGYIEEPVNPRTAGMGCAGTAISSGGFAFYNPAGAATIGSSFVAFEFGQQWGELNRGLVETAWIFPQWFIGASFQTQSIDYPTSDITGVLPEKGSEKASMISIQSGWRKERYAIGAGFNAFPYHIANLNAFALSLSGGIALSILPEKLYAGASLLHAGRYHRGLLDDSTYAFHRDSMPTTARIGATWRDTIIGKLPLTLSLDAVYRSNYAMAMIPVGCEIRVLPPLAVRLGKRFVLKKNTEEFTDIFTFGVGVSWENLAFDAALTPTTMIGDLDIKWLMGLRYSLPAKKKSGAQKQASPSGKSTSQTPPTREDASLPSPELPSTDTIKEAGDSIAASTGTRIIVPDTAVPDTAVPDTAVPDTAVPDTAVPDTAVPDTAVPDTAVPDTAVPDTAVPDTAVPDTAVSDTAVTDTAVTDTAATTVPGSGAEEQVPGSDKAVDDRSVADSSAVMLQSPRKSAADATKEQTTVPEKQQTEPARKE